MRKTLIVFAVSVLLTLLFFFLALSHGGNQWYFEKVDMGGWRQVLTAFGLVSLFAAIVAGIVVLFLAALSFSDSLDERSAGRRHADQEER